ncbi:molybdate ABC transporter substrate-binding protein [Roseinatronobacter alkalisoli]|uniref:Molybdate ABC transporter substrate-binding protein n=1 Tax=Roseinatronobacter alkalisoli TaxID=3028235 RepID=A0ABT5T9R2_9RHOB|nr:molybdate ABC transporter substrate-binding protein [Roseinatronobacter sp. HJB301]MDD7970668.1 molybdate ABC transporter substrate-binding protein [Roseinatronobacter sp. HJB301]
MSAAIVRRTMLAAAAAFAFITSPASAQNTAPVIAAASDLQFALTEIAAAFHADTGMDVRLSFGSTGNFARQIREGAPFQIFMAADERFIAELHADGFSRDNGDLYALGRVVIMVPGGSTLTPDAELDHLAEMLAAGQISRFAIANPDHAPYGMRAREALITRGIWDDLQSVLVLGENVSQAAQFALSGNAEGGIIAYALALAPEIAPRGTYVLIPDDWHSPLRQRMVLLNNAGDVARAFYAYMNEPAARDIMDRYGFALPEGE